MTLQFYGSMALQPCSSTILQLYGSMILLLYGSTNLRLYVPVPVSGTCVEHAFICRGSVVLALLYCYSAVFCCLIKALHEPAVHWFKRCLIYWRGGSVQFNPSLIFNEEVHFYASSASAKTVHPSL